jgi:hypothetical protein
MTFTLAGATGRLRPLTPLLLARGRLVRVLARQMAAPAGNALSALGAEIWPGDFDAPGTLVSAAAGWRSFERWAQAQDRAQLTSASRAA